jgi:predicted Rossmann fold flavoprotein
VPLLLNTENAARYCDLAGVSTEVIASCSGQRFREKMLVTHRGLSGPAILQISSYWNENQEKPQLIRIDLAPDREVTVAFRDPAMPRNLNTLRSELHKLMPHRLADRWLNQLAPTSWTNDALAELENKIHNWAISPAGTEGYDKAEVTAGGVDTAELSARTMESRTVPGLFFIGEVVDVTGQLGGFNFQWAWASGVAAGRAL